MKEITITMQMDKATENTIHFTEITENEFTPEKLGGIYVQKFLLEQMDYHGGKIIVTIGNTGDIKFLPEEKKKSCVLFAENVADDFHAKRIGKIYMPKYTLEKMEYAGDAIYIGISIAE